MPAAKNEKSPRSTRNAERTRAALLDAATAEFSTKGLDGATIEAIADRAGTSKQLVYHYFGSKDDLYREVIEKAYVRHRAGDEELETENMSPEEAVGALVRFVFENSLRYRDFSALVADENRHGARHIKESEIVLSAHRNLVRKIRDILERGEAEGVFREGVDPVWFYISLTGMVSFYFTNRHTLSAIFRRKLDDPASLESWLDHLVATLLHSLYRPCEAADPARTATPARPE